MKKGCALTLALWIALVGAYGYVAWQRIHEWPPAIVIGVLGGTFAAMLVGSFAGLFTGARERGAFKRAASGEAMQDGRLEVASGPIRPLGAPLEAPFTGRPCVAYEYDVKRPGADRSEFAGVALAPCAVDTPRTSVRVLGWAILDEFPRGGGTIEPSRGAAYLGSVPSEPLGLTSIVSVMSDLLTDDDGAIRKDFRIGGATVDLQGRTIEERIVPAGEVVTLLGRWSEAKRGFAPAGTASMNQLFAGDLESVASRRRGTAVKTFGIGLFFFLALHAILVPMYFLAPSRGGSSPQSSPSVWDERDCDRQKTLLNEGADANEVGDDGLTALMNAARQGDAACVQQLIAAGARLEAEDKDGNTALAQAVVAGREDNVELLRKAGAKDFRVTAATGRPMTGDSGPFGVVKDYLAALHRGDIETMTRLMSGPLAQRMEEQPPDLAVWQALRPKTFELVEGWMNEDAATLTVQGPALAGDGRVSYQIESYQVEAGGPKTWRITKEWFPDPQ
jgi:hypothetical protein